MSALLEVENLHKTYETDSQPLEVLKGLDLKINSGVSLAILGASGAGKSTLLHILGTLDYPSQGRVRFAGKDLFANSEREQCEFRNLKLGFVFQFHHLLPMLTALENTMLPALIAKLPKREAGLRAQDLLKRVGLKAREDHRPAELSGGEQQRVALARSLVMRPQLLLADEPTGNLDSKTGGEVTEILLELQAQFNMTLVVVTHNQNVATLMNERVLLEDGRIQ